MILPQKIMRNFMRDEIKKIAAFQRNKTVREKGGYNILGLAKSKRGNQERRWCSEMKREIKRSFRENA